MPEELDTCRIESLRCKLYMVLHELAFENHEGLKSIVTPCIMPNALRASDQIDKGNLVLVPVVSSISQILKESSGNSTIVVKTNLKVGGEK